MCEAWGKAVSRGRRGGVGGGFGRKRGRRLERLVGCGPREADELTCRLELLILRAEPLELEPQQRPGGLCDAPTPLAAAARGDPFADRAANDWERLSSGVLEDPSQCLPRVGSDELPNGVANRVKYVSEKLLELLLVCDLEEL
jgi:hypothetical protein